MRKTVLITIIVLLLINSCSNNLKSEKKNVYVLNNKDTVPKAEIINKNPHLNKKIKSEKIIDTLPPIKIVRTIEDYKKSISKYSIKTTHKLSEIENLIPTTEKEFDFFYDLTYSDESNSNLFNKINLDILNYAMEDKGDVFFLYTNMSEFVDGEYAEAFYADLEMISKNNKEKFCFNYKYLSEKSKKLLEDMYNDICNGIKRKED